MPTPTHICRNCLTQVRPRLETPGSFGLELILWLLFVLPGIAYSCWRMSSRRRTCPVCGATEMVPLKTPAAAILLNTPGLPSPPIRVVPARPTGPSASLRFGRAVGFLFHRRKRTSQTP